MTSWVAFRMAGCPPFDKDQVAANDDGRERSEVSR